MSHRTRRIFRTTLAGAALLLASSQALLAPAPTPAQPWAVLAWDTDVGRILGQEADSEGPKSFAIKPDGGVLVLDQVNRRILDLNANGTLARTLALPTSTFDDVEQFEGRAVLALDRLVAKTLRVMDRNGAVLVEVALEGRGIERAGLITALLPRPDGVWLEVQHRHSVKVLDSKLAPCEREVVLGRPIANGRSLHAALDGHGSVTVSTSRRNARASEGGVTLTGKAPIRRIVWTDADAQGVIHAILHEAEFAAESPYHVRSERYRLIDLDDRLREVRNLESPWVLTEYDQRVEFRVGPDGRVWQMAFGPDGVRLIDWSRRAP